MRILSGSSNPKLAKNIAQKLKLPVIKREITQFSNGEKRVWIKESLQGQEVVLVQSLVEPVDQSIIETLLLVDALERLGAKKVTLAIPWMGYSLQDKVFRPGEPISAKVIANIISNSFIEKVLLMDLHNDSIPGFFDIPTHYLSAMDLFAEYAQQNLDLKKSVVVSPDFGGLKRARTFAKKLDLDLINIDKTRDLKTGEVRAVELHGDVNDKIALVLDDVIVSGGTTVEAAEILKQNGAKQVLFLASHGLLTNQAVDKITQSETDQVVITNSIEHQQLSAKFKVLDVASVFAANLSK